MQTSFTQHPAQVDAHDAGDWQVPLAHVRPVPHARPPAPHCVAEPPLTHAPLLEQHPKQLLGPHATGRHSRLVQPEVNGALRLSVRLGSVFGLFASAGAAVPLWRRQFIYSVDGIEVLVHQVAPVVGQASVGIAVQFQ